MNTAFVMPVPVLSGRAAIRGHTAISTRRVAPAGARVAPAGARAPRQTPTMHGPPAHAHGGADGAVKPGEAGARRRAGEHKGFVEEMRFVAMRLHTKDQAPREGGVEESALPIDAWYPLKEDYMQFLVDSHCVYHYFETDLAAVGNTHPIFSKFANNGLERLNALEQDMAYLNGIGIETPNPTQAATSYVQYMQALLHDKPESLLCHWYNYYFAHSAGGRMIGRLMQDRLFNGRSFAFYEWDTDVKSILSKVRVVIDDVAAEWSREVKDECLKETSLAFGFSGTVLQNLAKAASN